MTAMLLGAGGAADAGSTARAEPQFAIEKIAAFAKKVERSMAAKGARVFVIGRLGSPAEDLPPGFRYTHVAFGVYSEIQTDDGRTIPGYAFYNLYQREKQPDISDLTIDYPVDFFAGVYRLEAGIVIPKPRLQRRLLALIASGRYRVLHNPHYSIVANPYNSRYQNCTEFTLDVINAAIYQTDDIRQLKADARAYFKAQPVHISPLKQLLAGIAESDFTTADQHGGIKTASFTTIARYLEENGLVQEQLVIRSD
jgi:hypothetical protein